MGGFVTDPAFLAFSVLFLIAIISGVIWHSITSSFMAAVVGSTMSSALVAYGTFAFWRGHPMGWIAWFALIPICAIVAAGVGIPFNRHRTGKGLAEKIGGIDV